MFTTWVHQYSTVTGYKCADKRENYETKYLSGVL